VAQSDAPWVHLAYNCNTGICEGDSIQGAGPATINYVLDANTTKAQRQATITVLDMTFTITQGTDCIHCGSTFDDVPAGYWAEQYIEALGCAGTTVGCGNNNFCPTANVTRGQMAAFIVRAKEGEPPQDYCGNGSTFNDIDQNHSFCRYIKRLRELGITTGCGNNNYCPNDEVPREQMAAFLVRAVERETFTFSTPPYFNDVPPTHWAFRYIQRLYELGITTGCGNGNYCPTDKVTREQMATFLFRAFMQNATCNPTQHYDSDILVDLIEQIDWRALLSLNTLRGQN
jgi:hypothetical protein